MVVSQHGEETWNEIRARAGVVEPQFIGMDPYDDSITYKLVEAASSVLEIPAGDLLEAFGEYWTLYTADEGYGELLSMAGETFEEALYNLDEMHARLALSMPELEPPTFHLAAAEDGKLELTYFSRREGLTPMVCGLIQGLASRFSVKVEIEVGPTRSMNDGYETTFSLGVNRGSVRQVLRR